MRSTSPYVWLAALGALAITLGTTLQQRALQWTSRRDSGGLLQRVLGDGRRLFANHFFIKADVSFHGGYYPSIFDAAARPKDRSHMTAKADELQEGGHDHVHSAECNHGAEAPETTHDGEHVHTPACDHGGEGHDEHSTQHEKDMALGKPRDWIESFGRRFTITEHKHLEGGEQREMLPWLRIAAELDPDQPDTYIVAAFWLRDMKRIKEAESFLREGLRNVPDSYEMYFALGELYLEEKQDVKTARNLWELALTKWIAAEKSGKDPDLIRLDAIAVALARLEESQGNLSRAIQLLEIASRGSPNPDVLKAQIAQMRGKLSTAKTP